MRPTRILLAHNYYKQRGGEDSVVESELAFLRGAGHEVECFFRHNDDIPRLPKLSLMAQTFWSAGTVASFEDSLRRFRPDVLHVHNTFPLLSPSLYWGAAAAGIPVVQTLHNFRLLCPQAMLLRDSHVCEDCVGRVPWRGAVRGCYRGSRMQSTVLAGMVTAHRLLSTYRSKVTRYIALNDFCRGKFVEGGLPEGRIVVKPNFVEDPGVRADARQGFLFVGRLSAEKGIAVLGETLAASPEVKARIAGTGPEAARLSGIPSATMMGALPVGQVMEEMSRASALVMPSIWYENFPRTLVESYACGLPVIASRLGALADLVKDGETGLLFEAGNADDLSAKLRWAQAHPDEMRVMGANARRLYEREFTPERNYKQLIAIYEEAVEAKKRERAS